MRRGLDGELLARMEELFSAITAKDLSRIEACYLNAPDLLVFLEGPRSRTVGWESIKVGWRHFLEATMDLQGFEWGDDLLIRVFGESGFVAATNRYAANRATGTRPECRGGGSGSNR